MKMYYGSTEAAEILGYKSGMVIRDYLNRGKIKGIKIGRNWAIHYQEINRFKNSLEAKRNSRK